MTSDRHSRPTRIIYCNQVDPEEQTGQGTHEKEMTALLLNDPEVDGFYVGQAPTSRSLLEDHPRATLIPIKKTAVGYISYQLRLFIALSSILAKQRTNTIIFLRYAPAMISPLLVSLIFRVPLVIRTGPVLRNLDVYEKRVGPLLKSAIFIVSALHYKRAKRVVVVTSTIKDYLIKNYKINPNKVVVSGNGCNTSTFTILPPDCIPGLIKDIAPNSKLVMFAGSFYQDTGIQDLVNSLILLLTSKSTPLNVVGVMMGDGPLKESLERAVQSNGLSEKIIFTGRLPQVEVNKYLNRASICVVPFNKLGLEQTGSAAIKVFEYLAAGAPVLATEHPDHEFIEQFGLGALCAPDDLVSMTSKIIEMVEKDPNDQYEKYTRRSFVTSNYTWTASYRRLRSILDDALSNS